MNKKLKRNILSVLIAITSSYSYAYDIQKEALDNSEFFIKYSYESGFIQKSDIDDYYAVKNYQRNNPQNALSSEQEKTIELLSGLKIGETDLGSAAIELVAWRNALDTHSKMTGDGGALTVFNELSDYYSSKWLNNYGVSLTNQENYDQDSFDSLAGDYTNEYEKALNQLPSITGAIKANANILSDSSTAAWKISRATFLDTKKIEASIAAKEAVDNIGDLPQLAEDTLELLKRTKSFMTVIREENATTEDYVEALRLLTNYINDTSIAKIDKGVEVFGDLSAINGAIDQIKEMSERLQKLKNSVPLGSGPETKWISDLAESVILENILKNINTILNTTGKYAGIEAEINAVTSTIEAFNSLHSEEYSLNTVVSKAKNGRLALEKGIGAFDTVSTRFELDLGVLLIRNPEVKDEFSSISSEENLAELDYQSNLSDKEKQQLVEHYLVLDTTESNSSDDAPSTINKETSGNLTLTYSESNISTLELSLVKGNQQNGFMQTSAQASMGPDHSPREIENVYAPDVAYGAEEFSYTEWGRWSGNDPDYPFYENKSGYVVLGVPTPDDYLPDATGTATYTGDVMGAYSGGSYGDGYLGGRTRLTADFDTNTIEGALFLNRIYSAGETEQMRTVTFEYAIDQQGSYGGMLTVGENPGAGQLYGEFYGPQAEETGGAFVFSHQDAGNQHELVEGVYRARQ